MGLVVGFTFKVEEMLESDVLYVEIGGMKG